MALHHIANYRFHDPSSYPIFPPIYKESRLFLNRRRGRSSGGGGMFGRSKPKAPSRPTPSRSFGSSSGAKKIPRRAAPPPAKRPQAPPPAAAPAGGGMLSGLGSTIMQGMAFGTGSAIAHRAVGAAAGALSGDGEEKSHEVAAAGATAGSTGELKAQSCDVDTGKFYDCLDEKGGNIAECQFFFDMMQQCQKEASLRSQFN